MAGKHPSLVHPCHSRACRGCEMNPLGRDSSPSDLQYTAWQPVQPHAQSVDLWEQKADLTGIC